MQSQGSVVENASLTFFSFHTIQNIGNDNSLNATPASCFPQRATLLSFKVSSMVLQVEGLPKASGLDYP